jgi:hypothetical protein
VTDAAPVEILDLDNGLTLELYDHSKRIAGGDRWTVILVARIDVEVSDHEAAAALGPRITYEQKRERVFVDDAEKGAAFGELRTSFLSSQQVYLSRADFGERFVRRQLHLQRLKPTP